MGDQLIQLKTESLRAARPDWPWSGDMTSKMVRAGKLGCVRVGRRVYVTPELMADFIARNTRPPEPRAVQHRTPRAEVGAKP